MPRFDMSDLSHHQGRIDWSQAGPALPFGATTKVNEGSAVDVEFTRNIAALRLMAKGRVKFSGGYFWPLPSSKLGGLKDQAKFFLDKLQPQVGDLIQMDNEEAGLDKKEILLTLDWLTEQVGRPVLNYMGRFYGNSMILDPAFKRHPWWFPAYISESRAAELVRQVGMKPVAWQWGGGAQGPTIPGIVGRIDANRIEDMAMLRRCAGYVDAPPVPEVPPVVKEQDVDQVKAPAPSTAVFVRGGVLSWVEGPQSGHLGKLYGDPKVIPTEDFKNYRLVGPIPTGDTGRVWTKDDFFSVETGPKGDPGESFDHTHTVTISPPVV